MRRTQGPAPQARSVAIDDGRHIQLLEPSSPNRSPITIVMVPGGGLSSAIYLDNGSRSWARRFSAAGYRVVLVDPPDETVAPRWSPGTAFPVWGVHYDQAGRQSPSRFDASDQLRVKRLMASPRKALDAGELGQVLSDYAPTIAVGHSFGGKTVIEATASRKDVLGIVLVEPVGCPTDTAMLQDAFVHTGRALLSIWGDNLERGVPSMIARKAACVSASREILDLGGRARVVELPTSGIAGNSHLMMAEDNSDQIADLILQWVKGLNPNFGID